MGQVHSSSSAQDPKQFLQTDIPNFSLSPSHSLLSRGKFLKTFNGKINDTDVVIKVYFRQFEDELLVVGRKLSRIWKKIPPSKYPNLLPYQMWLKSQNKVSRSNMSPTYLIRQFILHNLHDRLSTRPFLHNIEKRFIAFQLMKCVKNSHDEGIFHGDINPENIMVTSWNWVILTDFSPFKPTMIPEDDPADFNYYFDSMGRKRCYMGPERFMKGHVPNMEESKNLNLNLSSSPDFSDNTTKEDMYPQLESCMDVYSLGCTIGEIFLNEPFIDLPNALKYVSAPSNVNDLSEDGQVNSNLNRIPDDDIKKLVSHMTRRKCTERKKVKSYLEEMEISGSFPSYFAGVMYDFFLKLHWKGNKPDDRIRLVADNFGELIINMNCTTLFDFDFTKIGKLLVIIFDDKLTCSKSIFGRLKRSFDDIDGYDVVENFNLIVSFLDEYCTGVDNLWSSASRIEFLESKLHSSFSSTNKIFNKNQSRQYDSLMVGKCLIELLENNNSFGSTTSITSGSEGLLLIIQVICSSTQHLYCPHAKVVSILLLVCLGRCSGDDVIMQRVLPFIVIMIEDEIPLVKATAVRACRSLIRMVTTFSPLQSNLFQFYIFPALARISKDSDSMVRVAFAESIGHFAEISKLFLDRQQMLNTKKVTREEFNKDASSALGQELYSFFSNKYEMEEIFSTYAIFVESSYDIRYKSLQDKVSRWIRDLMLDSSNADNKKGSGLASHNSMIKRALLTDIIRLCIFFGQESTMDILIPQLLTFLNDQDWELRYAFCAKITSVCVFVGRIVTSECIIPCIEMALYDVEEMVVCRAISSLSSLVQLSLLPPSIAISVVHSACPLLQHPSRIIQLEVIRLVTFTARYVGEVDSCVFILPFITKCTDCNLIGAQLTEKCIFNSLKPRLSRSLYRLVLHNRLDSASNSSSTEKTRNDLWIGGSTPAWLGENDGKFVHFDESPSHASAGNNVEGCSTNYTFSKYYEDDNLKVILPYVDSAAREICTKTMQWKNGLSTGVSTAAGVAATYRRNLAIAPPQNFEINQSPLPSTNLEGLLEISIYSLPEPRSLFIPSQKLGMSRPSSCVGDVCDVDRYDKDEGTISTMYAVSLSLDSVRSNSVTLEDFSSGMKLRAQQSNTEDVPLAARIRMMNIPPLPANFGALRQPDGRPYSMYTEALDMSSQHDNRSQWRPRENVLITSLWEHKESVNKLAVSRDQIFFASASSDKTVKIWQINSLDEAAFLKSSITYKEHQKPVNDLCVIENTHTVASASSSGSIHLWRIDYYKQGTVSRNITMSSFENHHLSQHQSVLGSTVLKTTNIDEGELLNVHHFNGDSASMLLYTTQKGYVHAWDLRNNTEPFVITVRPELGAPTCMALAPDRCWAMVGTSRGYIGLWDIRYNVLCNLWRHSSNSPIYRMACCKPIPKARSDIMQFTGGSYLFVAAGNNEAAVWGVPEGGECFRCFRSSSMVDAYRSLQPLPVLEEIPLSSHPNGIITHALSSLRSSSSMNSMNSTHSVRAIMGRISHTGLSYLVTAGTDKSIRFWDFMAPNRCVTISGLNQAQPKGCYETPSLDGFYGKLFMCLDSNVPSVNTILKAQIPMIEGRGPLPIVSTYKDSILDLKSIDVPARMILSCGRDGYIKLWR